MSVPDHLIEKYFLLLTDRESIDVKGNPRDAKVALASEIVRMYHGEGQAQKAKEEFERVFSRKEPPMEIPEYALKGNPISLIDVLVGAKLAKSKGDARRLVEQGGVEINGKVEKDWQKAVAFKGGEVIQAGKRKFIRVFLSS